MTNNPKDPYFDTPEHRLWKYLNNSHDVIMLESDLEEVIRLAQKCEPSPIALHDVRDSLIAYEKLKHSFLPPKYRKSTATNIVDSILYSPKPAGGKGD